MGIWGGLNEDALRWGKDGLIREPALEGGQSQDLAHMLIPKSPSEQLSLSQVCSDLCHQFR